MLPRVIAAGRRTLAASTVPRCFRRGVAGYRRASRLLALPMLRDEEGREQERAKHHINQGDCV